MDKLYLYILGLLEYCIIELFYIYIYIYIFCIHMVTCNYEIWEYAEFS
jgi:hypothetical protein